ncbi:MAG TPA: histidine kinase dimerization/phospho-acceptor domain-containing protein, partial [Burkholderiales bacterium]|nr:histidine kinase dimerization/phospho-acceptor domain-containing protein [Burkholderiales bacterium]
MREDADRKLLIYLAIAGLQLALLLLDRLTPRGITEWIFHILPIGLCLLQRRAVVPLIVAFSASLLILIGYLTSPPGGDPTLGAINRTMGVIALWCVAFIVRQTLFTRARIERLAWLNTGQAHIAKSTLGDKSIEQTGAELIAAVADYLQAQVAVLYRLDGDRLLRTASHALGSAAGAPESFKLGGGVVGQAARDGRQIVLSELPADYLKVTSATGAGAPQSIVITPIKFHGTVCGVIEFGFLRKLENEAEVLELLAAIAEDVGVALRSTLHRQRVLELLDETQRQSEELHSQQEELRVANEELTEQGAALRESQARLENQQAELEETNAQLAAQTADLERQKRELLDAQSAMKNAVLQLERASAYKSEFLANMSHELRTPLNSSLILSKVLADNAGGNLTEEQVNYAKVIQASNNDLLALINDILDLSKIEAGQVKIERERVALADVLDPLRSAFEPVAQEKNLKLRIDVRAHVPDTLDTDPRRLQQILRNLLSNALKFTHEGSV